MFKDLKNLLDKSYSYKKSLKRQNIKQENVNLLREKVKNSKYVPRSLTDKQVELEQIYIKLLFSSD